MATKKAIFKNLLFLAAFAILGIGAWYWYTSKPKGESITPNPQPATIVDTLPADTIPQ